MNASEDHEEEFRRLTEKAKRLAQPMSGPGAAGNVNKQRGSSSTVLGNGQGNNTNNMNSNNNNFESGRTTTGQHFENGGGGVGSVRTSAGNIHHINVNVVDSPLDNAGGAPFQIPGDSPDGSPINIRAGGGMPGTSSTTINVLTGDGPGGPGNNMSNLSPNTLGGLGGMGLGGMGGASPRASSSAVGFANKRQELFEQKLRLDFEEQKDAMIQRHKEELNRVIRKADKKLSMQEGEYKSLLFRRDEELASLKRKLDTQERTLLKDIQRKNEELEQRHDEIKNMNMQIDEKDEALRSCNRDIAEINEKHSRLEDHHIDHKNAFEEERQSHIEKAENLTAELESLTEQHQSYVDLAQQILDKKQVMHENQVGELLAKLGIEKTEAVRAVEEEMKKVQQDYEETINVLEAKKSEDLREMDRLNSDLLRMKDLVEELESRLNQQEISHEEWKKQHAIKEADWHTKATLRKLLTESQENLTECERKKTAEILQYKKDSELLLRQTRLQCEDEKNKLKTFFAERKQEYMQECNCKIENIRHDFECRYEELKQKEEELRQKAAEFRESMYEKQEQSQKILQMQKEEHKIECDKIHKDYTKVLYEQEEKLKLDSDRIQMGIRRESQANNISAEKEIAEREVKIAKLEGTIAALDSAMRASEDGFRSDLDAVLMKLQATDINYRNAYRKVQGFKVVQEAFRGILAVKWYSGLRHELIQRASELQGFSGSSPDGLGSGLLNQFIDQDLSQGGIDSLSRSNDLMGGSPVGGGLRSMSGGGSHRGSVLGVNREKTQSAALGIGRSSVTSGSVRNSGGRR